MVLPSAIHCRDLVVQFPGRAPAVNGVNCEFPAGKITALVGPSGCGKTTLLRCLVGLQRPSSGEVQIDPPVISDRGEIAFVFQQPTLLPWLNAIENAKLPMRLAHGANSKHQAEQRAREALRAMELPETSFSQFPRELSGGMRMRVSLARALVMQPAILLLDEPFAALDDMLRAALGELLLAHWQQQPRSIVLVTHNIAEAAMLSHQILIMRDGKITQQIENPLRWPRNEAVRTAQEFGGLYQRIGRALRGATT